MAATAGIRSELFQRARQGDAQAWAICSPPTRAVAADGPPAHGPAAARADRSLDVVQDATWRRPALPEYARESRCVFFSGCDS